MTKEYEEILFNLDWIPYEYDFYYDLEKCSKYGEDFIVTVKKDDFVENVREYAENFDPEEHAFQWEYANQRGVPGVPTWSMLIEDAYDLQDQLKTLARELTKAERKMESEVI